jgi:hypothetical protein
VDCLCFCHLFGKEPEALHAIEAAEHDPDPVVRSISQNHLFAKISKIIVAPSSGTEYPLPFETGIFLAFRRVRAMNNMTNCFFR